MKIILIVVVLQCMTYLVMSEDPQTKDLDDGEDLERRHRKRKKGQNSNPCGGGYGRTFDLFGLHDTTYVSAPVMNYFFGCGVAALPVAPIAPIQSVPYPINIGLSQSQNHHQGHLGGHGGGGHGGGGHGGAGGGPFGGTTGFGGGLRPGFSRPGFSGFGGPANFASASNYGGYNPGYNQQPYLQDYNQGSYQGAYQRPINRPLQNVVSAAASGLGNALADYISSRPRKAYKQINKQVNQFLKPLYKLF